MQAGLEIKYFLNHKHEQVFFSDLYDRGLPRLLSLRGRQIGTKCVTGVEYLLGKRAQ